MPSQAFLLVFLQNSKTANHLYTEFKALSFEKLLLIDNQTDLRYKIKRTYPLRFWGKLLFPLVLATLLVFFGLLKITPLSIDILVTLLIISVGFIATLGIEKLMRSRDEWVCRFQPLMISKESLILVDCKHEDAGKFIKKIRLLQEELPSFFVLTEEERDKQIYNKEMLPQNPVSEEKLARQAEGIAKVRPPMKYQKNFSKKFFKRIQYIADKFQLIFHKLNEVSQYQENIHLSAEWLLDNSYAIKGHIKDIHTNLPEKFFKELHFISTGPYQGFPTIYPLASRLIAATDGKIFSDNISLFLKAYQSITPLTMGELWAFPLILKIRLIECLVNLTTKILNRVRQNQLADFWSNRLLNALRKEPEKLYSFLAILSKEVHQPSFYFADQLMIQLSDAEAASMAIKGWLERKVGEDFSHIFHLEQALQTQEQTSLANIITSLHRLAQINWRDIFESVCHVDHILAKESSGIYWKLDFYTRDSYRHAVEKLAWLNKISESDVAREVVALTHSQSSPLLRHVGYYLIDKGHPLLEKALGYFPSYFQRFSQSLYNHSTFVYLSLITLFTITMMIIFHFLTFSSQTSAWISWTLISLSVIPFLELGGQIINFMIAHFLSPKILPKMSFDEGIPTEYKTLVVVPTMLNDQETIKKELEKLEIHFLANAEPNLMFGIVSDFKDASEQTTIEDDSLLRLAKEGIQNLNEKYQCHFFYLFHRTRTWNEGEQCWMGWERKRGKLEHLNRYLSGDAAFELDTFLHSGDADGLVNIRYVLTVDSDTQLPKNSVRHLIETLAHPLNEVQIDYHLKKITRGYTIIQPRVSTNYVSANATWFSKLFSDPSGIDPYTKSVSDIYQDIFQEGVYHGKGIYDYKAFHSILSKRLPENQILSHDLIEGSYVKAAFASDIELYDSFPQTYFSYCKRQHRWIRGDWQIVRWLWKNSYQSKGQSEVNPLSSINRWKILDNLKRSLLPLTLFLILIISWIANASYTWTIWVAVVIALPTILQVINCIWDSFSTRLYSFWNDILKGFLRTFVNLQFLPHQAWVNTDAILKALYRQHFSHKQLLEWEVSDVDNRKNYRAHKWQLAIIAAFSTVALGYLIVFQHDLAVLAFPFLVLWIISPLTSQVLEKKCNLHHIADLNPFQKQYIRLLARKTWRYFDDFVSLESHWLPPDNYQEKLRVEIAQRTSPTNIGLYLMSILSAHQMGYLTSDKLIERLSNNLQTLKKLERYEGHFLNWYDIQNLEPLSPKYVSTVDSGNLLASVWAVEQKLHFIFDEPVLEGLHFIHGMEDTIQLFQKALQDDNIKSPSLNHLAIEVKDKMLQVLHISLNIEFTELISKLKDNLKDLSKSHQLSNETLYWGQKLINELTSIHEWIENTLPWISWLDQPVVQKIIVLHPQGVNWKSEALAAKPTLRNILNRDIVGLIPLIGWLQTIPENQIGEDAKDWIKRFLEKVNQSFVYAEGIASKIHEMIHDFEEISAEMNMQFLYNQQRKLFTIGYSVSDSRLDGSCYDLLASEARLTSFIAIARGDVPVEHWWALGRPVDTGFGEIVLQSWGGTMFEYLMPIIWCKNFSNTLLDYACKIAVRCQIAYGNQRGIPWGISESAYSRLDVHKIYQYRAFGVPYLGLKRGLEQDLVVTPYSSALALMIDPISSVKNLKRLGQKEMMDGIYGHYEAIDYSRESNQAGKRGIVIHAYMAHHIGMSLAAYCNCLQSGYLQYLFHSHPRVKSLEAIFYERPAILSETVKGRIKERSFSQLAATQTIPVASYLETAHTPTPVTHLLSNGNYTVMITNSGGGFSRFQDLDITRWRTDVTRDCWGTFFYIHDVERNVAFSTAFHPLRNSTFYSVNLSSDKAEIKNKDFGIEASTEIVVSPEENVEVRCITLANLSMRYRHLEVTSYAEIALAPHKADLAHPAFSKMFIKTEAIDQKGLIAHRRIRSPKEHEHWCFHVVASAFQESGSSTLVFETSREKFIGRDRTLSNPISLERGLSNTQGYVLDPIFSLRKKVVLEPGKRTKVSFVTGYANSREEAIKIMDKYKDIEASLRSIDMSWTHSELDLRRLHISHEDAKLFQRLANFMLYPDHQLRASSDRLRRNRFGQEKLWAHGISGDYPILLVTIQDAYDLDVIHSVLQAHTFWHLKGFTCDLVILNEERSSYEQALNEYLLRAIQTYTQFSINKSGGVYLKAADQIHRDDLNLLFSVAHAVIVAGRGSLSQQLATPRASIALTPYLKADPSISEEPSSLLPFLELLFFNGIGGFTTDGKEYAIYLENQNCTPMPWINVIANQKFGFLASERGLGMCWSGNSQTNRLTPWSNDPTVDPITDVVYIRDDDMGKYWSITSAPIRERDPYRTRHGHGYTIYEHNSHAIEQEMTVFTPIETHSHPSIRIQLIRLVNQSSHTRRLSLFSYVEWVLGQDREESQRYLLTTWDHESQTMMAFNNYRKDFSDKVAFLSCSPYPVSYTSNRKEFIGRNGLLSEPEVLKRSHLSNTTGAVFDPCGALQISVELHAGESTEIIILLGEGSNIRRAKELVLHYQNHDHVHTALKHTKQWWNEHLNKILIQTPDKSVDFIFNRWLAYQNLSCRIWGRSAFYQSGGAYGFRDQLQDSAALLYFEPSMAREHILKSAARQFIEGDVQHWWHAESGNGVRTRISDDLLWLPYVALHYLKVTQDQSIMDQTLPYLEGRILEPTEHEAFIIPTISSQEGTLKEHCIKAIDKALSFGPHHLPLIGGGDWNDGMNWVGAEGKGESVWLGWFLIYILREFGDWLRTQNENDKANSYIEQADQIFSAIEQYAWDGEWYLRAFFDDGTPIGSHQNIEDKIDSLSQSWAILSDSPSKERSLKAMESVEHFLIDDINRLVLLFTPPFDKSPQNPGYIKGYPPGVRENGGQYTHAALWVAMAFAKMGNAEKALKIINMINPINRSKTQEDILKYRVEPYVTVADIYSLDQQLGHGGWSWYTGSASLMYRVLLESIMGFNLQGNTLLMNPTIPAEWDSFQLRYQHGSGHYQISIENPNHVSKGVKNIEIDGQQVTDLKIPLSPEGGEHVVKIVMG